jgi:type VI secretion system secreted protein VgrG
MKQNFEATAQLPGPAARNLHLLSWEGTESLSGLFAYSLVAAAKRDVVVDFATMLGQPATVSVVEEGQPTRHFNGLIASARFEGPADDGYLSYRFDVVPWLWMGTHSANTRIFAKLPVADILTQVLGFFPGDRALNLSGSFVPREFCVQYAETDLDFASRLMESEGIYYFFRHAQGSHKLVLVNERSAHVNEFGLRHLSHEAGSGQAHDVVTRWSWRHQIRAGKVTLRDHNFELPSNQFEATHQVAQLPYPTFETYEFPAGLPWVGESDLGKLQEEAARIARLRLEGLRSDSVVVEGSTNALRLCAGARFELRDHPQAAQNAPYIVHSTSIRLRQSVPGSGAQEPPSFDCDFTAFPATVAFRPPRSTPKPRIQGVQTAVVTGADGQEIDVDKYGRVLVTFPWARAPSGTPAASCRVRVAQPAAGKGFGMVALPRVGQEVVVEFMGGDPDQPIIVGAVYNPDCMPPLALPDHQTVSTLRSHTRGGGDRDFNEIRFEDDPGKEYVYLQAQKDRIELVKETSRTEIGKDHHLTVKKDRKEIVEGEYHLSVTKAVKQQFDDEFSLKAKGEVALQSEAGYSLKTTGDTTVDATGAITLKTQDSLHLKVSMNGGLDAGTNVHIKGGANVVIEAGAQLTLKAGGSSIVLGPDGVSITGAMVKINSGGGPGSGSGVSPKSVKAPKAPAKPDETKDPV